MKVYCRLGLELEHAKQARVSSTRNGDVQCGVIRGGVLMRDYGEGYRSVRIGRLYCS